MRPQFLQILSTARQIWADLKPAREFADEAGRAVKAFDTVVSQGENDIHSDDEDLNKLAAIVRAIFSETERISNRLGYGYSDAEKSTRWTKALTNYGVNSFSVSQSQAALKLMDREIEGLTRYKKLVDGPITALAGVILGKAFFMNLASLDPLTTAGADTLVFDRIRQDCKGIAARTDYALETLGLFKRQVSRDVASVSKLQR